MIKQTEKPILVTGAAGFIGYHLAKRLLNAGYAVAGIDNLNDYYDPALKRARLDELASFEQFSFTEGDLADESTVEEIFARVQPEIVVNLAAQAGVRYSIDHPRAYIESNVLGRSDKGTQVEQAGPALKSGNNGTFLLTEDLMPVLFRGSERKAMMPNGDGFYIWASLSPDGSKILYNYRGQSSFICDTDGRILHDLGRINAPKWFNDRLVIGMDDKDDGHRITGSELVYYSLGDKKRVILTSTPDRSEMFPFAAGNRRIAFCTDNGEIYMMKVRIR